MPPEIVRKKTPPKKIAGLTALYVVAVIGGVIAVLPFVLLVLSSLKTVTEYYALDFDFFPKHVQWSNYATVFSESLMPRWIGNTLFITVLATVIQMVSSIFVSYGFAKFRCRYNGFFFMLLLSTMMIPWAVTMIPSYTIWAKLNLVDSYLPLILPSIGGSAVYTFMFRQTMMGLSGEMSEAAKIDGCSSLRTLWQIIVPNMVPSIMTMVIFTAMGVWGDYLGPLLYVTDIRKFTVSLGLNMMAGQQDGGFVNWPGLLAGCVLFALPLIVLYFVGTRAFQKGLSISSLK